MFTVLQAGSYTHKKEIKYFRCGLRFIINKQIGMLLYLPASVKQKVYGKCYTKIKKRA